jgi:3-dehydroquinate dehydratase
VPPDEQRGEFIKWCHDAYDNTDGMVVNPAAWTHYAWSHDALEPLIAPVVEVHLRTSTNATSGGGSPSSPTSSQPASSGN